MDFFQLHPDLGADAPPESGAEDAGAEIVVPVVWITEHAGEVFRDVL